MGLDKNSLSPWPVCHFLRTKDSYRGATVDPQQHAFTTHIGQNSCISDFVFDFSTLTLYRHHHIFNGSIGWLKFSFRLLIHPSHWLFLIITLHTLLAPVVFLLFLHHSHASSSSPIVSSTTCPSACPFEVSKFPACIIAGIFVGQTFIFSNVKVGSIALIALPKIWPPWYVSASAAPSVSETSCSPSDVPHRFLFDVVVWRWCRWLSRVRFVCSIPPFIRWNNPINFLLPFVERDKPHWQSDSFEFFMNISRTFSAASVKSHRPTNALSSASIFLNVSCSRCLRP